MPLKKFLGILSIYSRQNFIGFQIAVVPHLCMRPIQMMLATNLLVLTTGLSDVMILNELKKKTFMDVFDESRELFILSLTFGEKSPWT
jgi:hypothetical protein